MVVVASFPSLDASQTDTQRGAGVFETSIGTLRMLNAAGYGREGSGLELDLVSNPAGRSLPPEQAPTEAQFHRELARAWGITFNHLYTFANMPLGRFRSWLMSSGNLEGYLRQLAESFNPCTVGGLMCRNLVSVSWDGVLYDCDFNLARGLPLGGVRTHVSSAEGRAARPARPSPPATTATPARRARASREAGRSRPRSGRSVRDQGISGRERRTEASGAARRELSAPLSPGTPCRDRPRRG